MGIKERWCQSFAGVFNCLDGYFINQISRRVIFSPEYPINQKSRIPRI